MDQKRLIKELLEKYWIVGIDTAAFIYHFEENKEYLPFTDVLFEMIETGKIRGVTSTITLMEVLVKPKRDGNERAVDEYKFILQMFPNLEIRQVDAEVGDFRDDQYLLFPIAKFFIEFFTFPHRRFSINKWGLQAFGDFIQLIQIHPNHQNILQLIHVL